MEDNYNIVLVLPYVNMNQPQVYICSPNLNHPHFPPHLIQGCPGTWVLGDLLHALNLHLATNFTYGNIRISMLFSQITPPSNWNRFSNSISSLLVSVLYFSISVFQTFSLLPSYLLWWSLLSVLFYLFFPNFYNLHISFIKLCFLVLADMCYTSECLCPVPQFMLLPLAFQH